VDIFFDNHVFEKIKLINLTNHLKFDDLLITSYFELIQSNCLFDMQFYNMLRKNLNKTKTYFELDIIPKKLNLSDKLIRNFYEVIEL